MVRKTAILWVLHALAGVVLVGVTLGGLAPWIANLLEHMKMPHPEWVGACMALAILCTAASAKLYSGLRSWVIIASLVLLSVAMFGARWTMAVRAADLRYKAAIEADLTRQQRAHDEAQARKDAAIAKAEAKIKLGYDRMIPRWREEGRADRTRAEAMAVPAVSVRQVEVKPVNVIEVAGPAVLELSIALLVELMGGAWGAGLAWLLVPLATRNEEASAHRADPAAAPQPEGATDPVAVAVLTEPEVPSADPLPDESGPFEPTSVRAALWQQVDVESLDADAREGLDLARGTWRGLTLAGVEDRDGIAWPVVNCDDERVFIGSIDAFHLARDLAERQRRGTAPADTSFEEHFSNALEAAPRLSRRPGLVRQIICPEPDRRTLRSAGREPRSRGVLRMQRGGERKGPEPGTGSGLPARRTSAPSRDRSKTPQRREQ